MVTIQLMVAYGNVNGNCTLTFDYSRTYIIELICHTSIQINPQTVKPRSFELRFFKYSLFRNKIGTHWIQRIGSMLIKYVLGA